MLITWPLYKFTLKRTKGHRVQQRLTAQISHFKKKLYFGYEMTIKIPEIIFFPSCNFYQDIYERNI